MSAARTLEAYLGARRAEIDDALNRALPVPPACPTVISEAMRYSLMGGGKRLRPTLTLAAADAVALAPAARLADPHAARGLALPAACAVEMIHTYSLIHDDLPAMDNDVLRRGRATAHVVYGDAIAILAGDGLLTEAFGLLAREPATEDPDLSRRRLRTIARIAEAAGTTGMVGGQVLDLVGEARDAEGLRAMHARKTGALIRAATTAGAIMAGGSDRVVDAIDRYASEVGLAFQIIDDVLDVEGQATELGKTAGKDAASGKTTYVALFGVQESRRLADECIARARATLVAEHLEGWLPELAQRVIERRS